MPPVLCSETVVRLAEEIRAQHHPELEGARIAYLFVPKGPVSGGVVRLGKAKKQSELQALVSGKDFLIILSADQWEVLDGRRRAALLDHELCHCWPKFNKDGEPDGWTVRHHDLEDFAAVVERHGPVFKAQQRYVTRCFPQFKAFVDQMASGSPAASRR